MQTDCIKNKQTKRLASTWRHWVSKYSHSCL